MNNKFKLVDNIKHLIITINSLVINYPRRFFVLRDRLVNTSYDLLELVYLANSMEDRINLQKRIIAKISMLDAYLEMSYKERCISLKKMQSVVSELRTINRMVIGWINYNGSKVR